MSWQEDFADFNVPDAIERHTDLTDISRLQDLSPSFTTELETLVIYVDREERNLREIPGPRFVVIDRGAECNHCTDDLDEVLTIIGAAVARERAE